jgi:hypothetical protein
MMLTAGVRRPVVAEAKPGQRGTVFAPMEVVTEKDPGPLSGPLGRNEVTAQVRCCNGNLLTRNTQ